MRPHFLNRRLLRIEFGAQRFQLRALRLNSLRQPVQPPHRSHYEGQQSRKKQNSFHHFPRWPEAQKGGNDLSLPLDVITRLGCKPRKPVTLSSGNDRSLPYLKCAANRSQCPTIRAWNSDCRVSISIIRAFCSTNEAQSSDCEARSLIDEAPSPDNQAQSLIVRAWNSDDGARNSTIRVPGSDYQAFYSRAHSGSSSKRYKYSPAFSTYKMPSSSRFSKSEMEIVAGSR